MTYARRLIFACTVCFLGAPADFCAADDGAIPAASFSFAYKHRHPVTALPGSAIDKVAPPDGKEVAEQETFDLRFAPPPEIGVAPARELSRSDVCNAIVSAARANDLPVPFFANLIWQESNFDTVSISPAGAQGIAQFMPRTAFEFGLLNPFEPIHALFTAGEFLRKLSDRFGNLGLAAAAYNAGPKRVSDWLSKRGALPDETRHYVRKITGRPADQWTSRDFVREPEAALMPARAPCYAVVEEVEAQHKMVRVAHLMEDLAAATGRLRKEPDARPFDEVAWAAATSKPDWHGRAVAMVRTALKHINAHETRQAAAAHRATKTASRGSHQAPHSERKAVALAEKKTAPKKQAKLRGKIQDRVASHAAGPARRAQYASASR